MKDVFVIRVINLKQKTENDIKLEFEKIKQTSTYWQQKNLNDYIDYLQKIDNYYYDIKFEDVAYCDEFDKAKEILEKNIGDINDGGIYNYALILKAKTNYVYPFTKSETYVIPIFKFNKEKNIYEQIEFEYNNETMFIKRRFFI